MTVRRTLLAAAVLVPALVLTGCAAGADSASSSGASSAPLGLPETASGADLGIPEAEGGTRSQDAPGTVALDRSVVVVAATTVRVEDVTVATDRVGALVAGAGGRIETQQVSRGGGGPAPLEGYCPDGSDCPAVAPGYAVSTTTVRLDNVAVDGFLRDVAALGEALTGSRSSTDVSAEVADVDARLRSAEASLARVRALLARAETISDVVALEGELARRQADLEALQARQRVLDDQTAQATVTVTLVEQDVVVAPEESTGFLAGLRLGWDAFTSAMVVGLTAVGAVLPFALLGALLALAVWLVVRRTRRSRPAPPSAPATT